MKREIRGTVISGKRIGHTLGFPTANIEPEPGTALPENGVYVAELRIGDAREWLRCVLNQGMQPTLPSGRRTIEAHILDFHRDIYGQKVALRFLKRLRPERKFDSKEALVAQLQKDVEDAKTYEA